MRQLHGNRVGRLFGRCVSNRLLSVYAMRFTTGSPGCTLRRTMYWGWIPSLAVFGTCQGASTITRKILDWKSSRISVWIANLQIGSSIILQKIMFCLWRVLTCIQVAQYILVTIICSCLLFALSVAPVYKTDTNDGEGSARWRRSVGTVSLRTKSHGVFFCLH
jgi:hypothetical protein